MPIHVYRVTSLTRRITRDFHTRTRVTILLDGLRLAQRQQRIRALMGNAYEHKCEQVLDPSYAPNPSDPDEVALFESQQRFMYSVFAKTLVEGKAADILREYSDP